MSRPFCRRCLLEDMPSGAALAASVQELVEALPQSERVPDDEKARRLYACTACDHLIDGMCALCGCYVQLRAAKSRLGCPDVPPRWEKYQAKPDP